MPYTNMMGIMETGQPCVILIKMEIDEGKMLSAVQLSKVIQEEEATILATLKLNIEAKEVKAPKAI